MFQGGKEVERVRRTDCLEKDCGMVLPKCRLSALQSDVLASRDGVCGT